MQTLVEIGKPAVNPLINSLGKSHCIPIALGQIGDKRALDRLKKEISYDSCARAEYAVYGLGELGDPNAIDALKKLKQSTKYREIFDACDWAIRNIERRQLGESWLDVDNDNPFDQIQRVRTLLFYGDRRHLAHGPLRYYESERKQITKWCDLFIEAMLRLHFRTYEEKALAWGILGIMIYYLTYPNAMIINKRCEKAVYCFEQCLEITPNDNQILQYLTQLRKNG